MKIQEVTIEGYQSHTNSTFCLSPGLTVITGPSDAGKTAIIRALRWFAFNEPTGEAFLHTIRNPDGSVKEAVDQVKVSVTFDNGITITKTRRKGKTTYTHSAFPTAWEKAEIPPEIKETLGLVKQQYGDFETCLNFAFQLDAPFMLSESASVGAKVLGKFLYGKTRKEVADKLREAQNKLDAGVIPGGDNVLFSTWVMNWLEIVIKPGIKERTYINYKASIEKHIIPGIGRYKLKDITDDVIQKYLNDQQEHGNLKLEINDDTGEAAPSHGPVAASSLIQQRRLIIAALEYAVDKGRINRNPGKKTRRPKSKPKTNNILTDEEMETLGIKGTKYRYYPAYMLTLTTACRRGEILGLDWQHVDIGIPWTTVDRYFPWGDIKKLPKWDTKALKTLLEDHNITLGDGYLRLVYQMVDDNGTPFRDELKTDLSRRSLMITEEMVLLLIFWRLIQNTEKRKATERGIEYNPDNLVFCTRKGTYIYPRNFTKMWSENLRSMGIDHKRFHDLRHTVATVMLEDGEAMNTVQEQLGHYDAGFTASRYGHVTAKMRNSAAVKLGERLEKVRNPEVEDEEDANSVKKEDTVIPFQEGRKLKSAACKIK